MLRQLLSGKKLPVGLIHLFGAPNTGKTTILYHMCRTVKKDTFALILDCELKFSAKRYYDILGSFKDKMNQIIIMQPTSLYEQFSTIMKLHNYLLAKNFSFVAINGITDFIRSIDETRSFDLNRNFSLQLAYLNLLSHTNRLPVVITNQITKSGNNDNKAVLSSIINYYSDINIFLKKVKEERYHAYFNNEVLEYKIGSTGISFPTS